MNLVTAVTLSLAFAYEPVEPGTMKRPPRPPGESILSHNFLLLAGMGIVVATATTTAFFAELARGADLDAARATAVTVLVVAQVAVLLNVRFLRRSSLTRRVLTGNRAIWISIAVLAVLQTAYTYLPPFHVWFGSVRLTPHSGQPPSDTPWHASWSLRRAKRPRDGYPPRGGETFTRPESVRHDQQPKSGEESAGEGTWRRSGSSCWGC